MSANFYDEFGTLYRDELRERQIRRMLSRRDNEEDSFSNDSDDVEFGRIMERGDSSESEGEESNRYFRERERNWELLGRYDEDGIYYSFTPVNIYNCRATSLKKENVHIYNRTFEYQNHYHNPINYFDCLLPKPLFYPSNTYSQEMEDKLNWLGAPLKINDLGQSGLRLEAMSNDEHIATIKRQKWRIVTTRQYDDLMRIYYENNGDPEEDLEPFDADTGDSPPAEVLLRIKEEIKIILEKKY